MRFVEVSAIEILSYLNSRGVIRGYNGKGMGDYIYIINILKKRRVNVNMKAN